MITAAAKAWVLNVACTKPKDHGLAAELWTLSALARYTREQAPAAGHPSLARAGKASIWRILHTGEIKPQKVVYYLERREEAFEQKMREVLMVYQEIALQNAACAAGEPIDTVITVSVDEKPGVQAIENTAPDLPPVPGKYPTWSRDHEYRRASSYLSRDSCGVCLIVAAGCARGDGAVALGVERDRPRHRPVASMA